MFHRRNTLAFLLVALLAAVRTNANTILDPSAADNFALFNLGTIANINSQYSNQIFYEGLAISGNNLLLSVGDPGTATQKVWSLPLTRVNGHITGLGSGSVYAPTLAYPGNCCLGNVMAGGLVMSGSDFIYTTQANSFLGQHTGGNPGSSAMLDLASTGASTGGLNYVPASFTSNGAGKLKMSSSCEPASPGCNAFGDWYTLNLGGSIGNYTLNSFTAFTIGVTAFSFDYVPADTRFAAPGMVLGDASLLRLDYYQLDADGNPCNPNVNISCAPIMHLVVSDGQIGLGIVRDPVTGDILFTSSDNQVWLLSEAAPEPATVVLMVGALAAIAWTRRLRRRNR